MITEERLSTFIDSFETPLPEYLSELSKFAIETNVPIIRPQMQSLLKFLMRMNKPMRILEVGCAIGFSALLMAEYSPEGSRITTIEKYEPRIPIALENFRKGSERFKEAGRDKDIQLLEGDATEILKELEGPYDLIFMDAAKGQYINFLPDIKRLLVPGGLLVSDNVLQDGDVVKSRFAVVRRDRTIHKRMREYLFALTHDEDFTTVILPSGDGVTLSYYR